MLLQRLRALIVVAGAIAGLSLFAPGVEAGGTYTRVDDEGVTHITDTPNDPRFQQMSRDSGTALGWLHVPKPSRGSRWGSDINEISERYGVPSQLVHAVIEAESAFNPWAVSRKGAQGLMQL